MRRGAEITVRLEFTAGATVSFLDSLLVSLDCPVCCRCWRTVVFQEGEPEGICTPTGHPFSGQMIDKVVARDGAVTSVVYRVAYRYEPFIDAKHPDQRKSDGKPTWSRVGFQVTCPRCQRVNENDIQTNIERPLTIRCDCGCVLYEERETMPVISWCELPGA